MLFAFFGEVGARENERLLQKKKKKNHLDLDLFFFTRSQPLSKKKFAAQRVANPKAKRKDRNQHTLAPLDS